MYMYIYWLQRTYSLLVGAFHVHCILLARSRYVFCWLGHNMYFVGRDISVFIGYGVPVFVGCGTHIFVGCSSCIHWLQHLFICPLWHNGYLVAL